MAADGGPRVLQYATLARAGYLPRTVSADSEKIPNVGNATYQAGRDFLPKDLIGNYSIYLDMHAFPTSEVNSHICCVGAWVVATTITTA